MAGIDGASLPAREPPPGPGPRKHAPFWADVDAVLASDVPWSELALGVSRHGVARGWKILASVPVVVEPDGDVRVSLFVQFYADAEASRPAAQRALAPMVAALGEGWDAIALSPVCVVFVKELGARDRLDGRGATWTGGSAG